MEDEAKKELDGQKNEKATARTEPVSILARGTVALVTGRGEKN